MPDNDKNMVFSTSLNNCEPDKLCPMVQQKGQFEHPRRSNNKYNVWNQINSNSNFDRRASTTFTTDLKVKSSRNVKQVESVHLTALMMNTFQAAKKNQLSYIQKNQTRYKPGDLNLKDQFGNSIVYYAVVNMHQAVLELLIKLGANLNQRGELGNTPLHYAFMVGNRIPRNERIIQTLIMSKANPRIVNDFGQTPVFFASKQLIAMAHLVGIPAMEISTS